MDKEQWERCKAIFGKALDMEPEARRVYLRGACRGDGELLKQLESLLDCHDRVDGFLDLPPQITLPPIGKEKEQEGS
jgi:hypothetical protein